MRGKVCLITGASSGIGVGVAVELASKGCRLSLTGRNVECLQRTLQKCIEGGAKQEDIFVIPGDIENVNDIEKILSETISKFGKLDVLVNNAGLCAIGGITSTPLDTFDKVINVNVRAVFYLTQLAVPHLIRSKGNVIIMSSVAGISPFATLMVYSMTKAALNHLTKLLALEMSKHNVRVNSVNPGYVNNTQILTRCDPDYDDTNLINSFYAMEGVGSIEDIGKAVAFLADDEQARFITGIQMIVDGGHCLKGPTEL